MGNRFKGEASTQFEGKTYTLRVDFNAMCAFEDMTGKNALAVFADFERGSVGVSEMRAMAWSFLRKHHPETDLDFAGDILSESSEILADVMGAAMPDADEVGELGNVKAKSQKAKKAA